jgi:hypothetical protein
LTRGTREVVVVVVVVASAWSGAGGDDQGRRTSQGNLFNNSYEQMELEVRTVGFGWNGCWDDLAVLLDWLISCPFSSGVCLYSVLSSSWNHPAKQNTILSYFVLVVLCIRN